MKERAYIILDVVDGKAEQAVQILRECPSVIRVDTLDNPDDIIIVLEAPERKQLAEKAMQALASVGAITEHARILPTRKRNNATASTELFEWSKGSNKKGSSKRLFSLQ